MLNELKTVNDRFISLIKERDGIRAAWYFGSAARGLSDEYSDIDIVILADKSSYGETDSRLTEMLAGVCDEVLICWGENFNGEVMKNYDYILSLDGKIFQYDVFLLNSGFIDDYMCRLHYTGLTEENIIFSKDNAAEELIEKAPKGEPWREDVKRLAETYWLHVQMSVKYFLRRDFFKLNKVLRTLMDTHTSLLLTGYDETNWGGAENKLKFIPAEKQTHLMKYGCTEDFKLMKKNLKWSMDCFENDANEIMPNCCKDAARLIKKYFMENLLKEDN